jgi:hypothetical protein
LNTIIDNTIIDDNNSKGTLDTAERVDTSYTSFHSIADTDTSTDTNTDANIDTNGDTNVQSEQGGDTRHIDDFDLDIGLFRDVDIDFSDHSNNIDTIAATDTIDTIDASINDNTDTTDNLYVYEYPTNDIDSNTNDIDSNEYQRPAQELFFDFDAFLRDNVNNNNEEL